MKTIASNRSRDISGLGTKVAPIVVASLLGVFLVWGAGFASPHAVHEAAHDTRHSAAFPCH